MIDTFAIAITHILLGIAAWRIMKRPDLDSDDGEASAKGWGAAARASAHPAVAHPAAVQPGQRPDA